MTQEVPVSQGQINALESTIQRLDDAIDEIGRRLAAPTPTRIIERWRITNHSMAEYRTVEIGNSLDEIMLARTIRELLDGTPPNTPVYIYRDYTDDRRATR